MKINTLQPFEDLERINALVKALARQYKPLQIYLYAHVKTDEISNSIFCNDVAQHSWYYLLLITERQAVIGEVHEHMDGKFKRVKLFTHGAIYQQLAIEMERSGHFFNAVFNNGLLLYGKAGTEVVLPDRADVTTDLNLPWQGCAAAAKGLLLAAERALEEGQGGVCCSLLYQAAAQVCVGLIVSFMGYHTPLRGLMLLLDFCTCFSVAPRRHFFGTCFSTELFEVILKGNDCVEGQEVFTLSEGMGYRCLEMVEGFLVLGEGLVGKS